MDIDFMRHILPRLFIISLPFLMMHVRCFLFLLIDYLLHHFHLFSEPSLFIPLYSLPTISHCLAPS